MDEVNLTRAQLKALAEKNEDITIIQTNTDAHLVMYERTKYRGRKDEAKWLMGNGRVRPDGHLPA